MNVKNKHRSKMQNELSGYVGCDVMEWIKHRQVEYGNTYPEIAGMLSESGWEIKPTTVQRWVSFERNRR